HESFYGQPGKINCRHNPAMKKRIKEKIRKRRQAIAEAERLAWQKEFDRLVGRVRSLTPQFLPQPPRDRVFHVSPAQRAIMERNLASGETLDRFGIKVLASN